MDLVCTTCGEPWSVDHVLHEADPEDFAREGGLISRCPCCPEHGTAAMSRETRERLKTIAAVAPLFGDDLDGFAAFLEDMDVIGFD